MSHTFDWTRIKREYIEKLGQMEGISSLKEMPAKQSVTVLLLYVDIEIPIVKRKGKTHLKNNFNDAFGKTLK